MLGEVGEEEAQCWGVVCTGLVCLGLSPLASIYSGLGESKWGSREDWSEERERAGRREERGERRCERGGVPGLPGAAGPGRPGTALGSLGSPGRQKMAAPGAQAAPGRCPRASWC